MYSEICINIYKKLIYTTVISVAVLCLICRFIYFSYAPAKTAFSITDTDDCVTVSVSGAVLYPGTYKLHRRNTVREAIQAAGGPTGGAVTDNLPLDKTLSDRQNIHITAPKGDGRFININTATEKELDTLPGIGPALSARIINYRNSHGLFSTPEQLLDIDGIGECLYQKLKNKITV